MVSRVLRLRPDILGSYSRGYGGNCKSAAVTALPLLLRTGRAGCSALFSVSSTARRPLPVQQDANIRGQRALMIDALIHSEAAVSG